MQYNLEQLQENKISRDMMYQYFNQCYNENKGDKLDVENIEFKVLVNGMEIENPFRYLDKLNNSIDNMISKSDEMVEKVAKQLVLEKYENLESQCSELMNKISELKESVDNKISWEQM